MSMGYGSNYADTVEESFIKEVCPDEWDSFMECFSDGYVYQETEGECSLETFAGEAQYNEFNQAITGMKKRYESLCKAFKKRTGLALGIRYHDPDIGDVYDDIEGVFWTVDGVYTYTSAGKKFKDKIARKFFVTFG